MPEYSFRCSKCSHSFSHIWSISSYDNNLKNTNCEKCGASEIFRNYQEDNIVVSYHEATTIGQLAEKNTKKMGKYELENRMQNDNMDLHKQNKEVSARRRKINKMNPTQKKKWIMEGD
jgi:hypothetical protein